MQCAVQLPQQDLVVKIHAVLFDLISWQQVLVCAVIVMISPAVLVYVLLNALIQALCACVLADAGIAFVTRCGELRRPVVRLLAVQEPKVTAGIPLRGQLRVRAARRHLPCFDCFVDNGG
jgi:hypothetical protein